MRIRSYLALMVAAILIPVMTFSAIALNLMLKAERESALKGVRETARISLVHIDRELTNSQSALRMLAISTQLADGNLAAFYEKARYADQLGATITALLDTEGQLLLTTSVPYGTPLPPTAARARVARVLAADQWQVSDRLQTAVTQQSMVVVDVPVRTKGGRRYVLSQGYPIGHFKQVLRNANAPPSWLAGLFDRRGANIAENGSFAQPALRQAIGGGSAGIIHNRSASGVPLYTVMERSALSGWTVAVGVPEAEIEAAARRALALSLLGFLAALLCAAGTAWLFARRLSISIRGAAESARAIGRGDAPAPTKPTGVDEVDAVQQAIADAGAVIDREQAQREIAEQARAQLYASEHAARTMAEQQNRAKDEFLAMLGHELRNPLAAIVNAAQVMHIATPPVAAAAGAGAAAAAAAASASAAARAGDIIVRQSAHLTRIVDDLLDVGRVQSGKIALARHPLRLDTLVGAFAEQIGHGRGAAHRISVDAAPVWIDADPTRMEQIVANLVDNAIKYTPAGGSIALTVAAADDGATALLTVADDGVGIEPALLPAVFDLFVQGERALDRAQGGLGLGLALVQRLASLHGGAVTVQSAGAGQGSRFEVRLPAVAAPAPAAPALSSSPAGAGRLRVLLVEDNDDGRDMMALMLEAHGFAVFPCAAGLEALAIAAAMRPDVAVIDIGLPGIDGYEVARRLRADAATAAMVLVALTGYGLDTDRQRASAAGFDKHLVKPVDLDVLLAVLAETASTRAPAPVP